MKTKLQISVKALVEFGLRSGDLLMEFVGSGRSLEGIRAHQKIQQARPPDYTPEVSVTHVLETEELALTVGGRIDGVYAQAQPPVIDEIKSTRRDLSALEREPNRLHWAQAQCYAYFYAVGHGLNAIVVQLTYVHLEEGEIREIRQHFGLDELERFFQDLVNRYLKTARMQAGWIRQRDETLRALEFPFPRYRPGQRRLAVEVYRAVRAGDQLLAQAATGTGKTMAVLFPAVKAVGVGLCAKIFFLTARTTGRVMAERTLDEMRRAGMVLKSLTLTAKDKICFCPQQACHPDECEFARGHYDRLGAALERAFETDALTRATVTALAQEFSVCPFEFSLELALWADCIICDYNYAFDPRVYLRRFFDDSPLAYTFLVDEAHNLVDRAREMFSAQLDKQPFLDLRRAVRHELPEIYRCLGRINTWMVKARKKCQAGGDWLADPEPPKDLYPLLRTFLKVTERWLILNLRTPFRDALLDLYFAAGGILRVSERFDRNYTTCLQRFDHDLRLKLFCINPAANMRQALERCRAAVFFSATLTPPDYFRDILGCQASARRLVQPSPFPDDNLALLVNPRISTYYRHRSGTAAAIVRLLGRMAAQRTGNYLFFFPSYAYMLMVAEAFGESHPQVETLVQSPEMTEFQRDAFLARFVPRPKATLVGFAVMGGVFGEGIDLAGEQLCGAAVIGVGLPAVSPQKELIRDFFAAHNGAGFEYAYLYPGFNRVLQAVGRVIRSETDRGAVLLVDTRFATRRYRNLFPREWRPLNIRNGAHLTECLNLFWDRKRSGL